MINDCFGLFSYQNRKLICTSVFHLGTTPAQLSSPLLPDAVYKYGQRCNDEMPSQSAKNRLAKMKKVLKIAERNCNKCLKINICDTIILGVI